MHPYKEPALLSQPLTKICTPVGLRHIYLIKDISMTKSVGYTMESLDYSASCMILSIFNSTPFHNFNCHNLIIMNYTIPITPYQLLA